MFFVTIQPITDDVLSKQVGSSLPHPDKREGGRRMGVGSATGRVCGRLMAGPAPWSNSQ